MRPSRAATQLALTVLGGMAAVGCGLVDVFASAGLEPVVLTYQGDTVVSLGTTVPFSVVVRAGGALLSQPRLRATSSDTTIFAVTTGQDSLRATNLGRATLTVRLASSILTDSAPTLQQDIRVRP